MRRNLRLYLACLAMAVCVSMGFLHIRGTARSKVQLTGTIKSSDGAPLGGITVSAQENGKTYTTTVYTNENGKFTFPVMDEGEYQLRIQAIGFKQILEKHDIGGGKSDLDFTMETRPDFSIQMPAIDWVNSLPAETEIDRRMRDVFAYTCSDCHTAGFVLEKRFDANGWATIIETMKNHQTSPGSLTNRIIGAYKTELVDYLARIRGPQPFDWKFKATPRPKGEETQVVVTEYIIPRGDHPDNYVQDHNGTDWDEGVPSRYDRTVMHDAAVNTDGNVYFTDNRTPERAFGKLDPVSGHVTTYKLLDKEGSGPLTHGIAIDKKTGIVWATNQTDSTFIGFDPKTEKFLQFPKPPAMHIPRPMIMMGIDSNGIMWGSQPGGAMRLDPATGAYSVYQSIHPAGMPYGIAVDSENNPWFNQYQADIVGTVDAKTGKVDQVTLPPINTEISPKDVELGKQTGMINGIPGVYQVGPRRNGADHHGDAIWVGEYFAGNLAKIDIHTKKVTIYPVPDGRYSHPYAISVDKNHRVWFSMANTDQIGRFDPATNKFTKFPLATRGSEIRSIEVDDSTDPPTVWVAYFASNKIARVQLLEKPTADNAEK